MLDVGSGTFEGGGGRELGAGGVAVLEEILFPEGPAAEDAGGAGFHGHADLLVVIRVIDAGGEEHPGPFAGGVEGLEVVVELVVGILAERAGELGLVDVAEPAELAGRLDDRLGLPLDVFGVGLLLAAERERDGLQQQEDVVLLALGIDVLDELELMLGRERLGRFELSQQLDGVGPHELDLGDAPARLDEPHRRPDLVLRAARHLDADQQARVRRDGPRGDARPGAVIGVDQHAGRLRRQLPRQVDLGLDDLLVGRLAIGPLGLQRLGGHLDHRAVLIQGHHGQGPVGIADPLQPPELARRQALAE